ncbi:MAG: hypothetical protein HY287_06085 [Planctomycetes bacterium]|nr:hypothetical protein [Planctomycetota bacterium]
MRNRIELLGMSAEAIGRLVRVTTLQAVAKDFAEQAIRKRVGKLRRTSGHCDPTPEFKIIEDGKATWAKDVL